MEYEPIIAERIHQWLSPPFDVETQNEIRSLQKSNPNALIDAFYTTLAFGTGGLRGLMGIGTNRMNRYTVRMATQGLANYLLKQTKTASVCIGFDSRHNSALFAKEAARVLAANQITVYFIDELRPTPFISYVCRKKSCTAAIMITASHNPSSYNGYKVFWSDGAQIVPPHDKAIIAEVNKITDPATVALSPEEDPLIHHLEDSLDKSYIRDLASLALYPRENQQEGSSLFLTYTSLHGTGITLVPQALKSWGFSSLQIVEKQALPDGDFPTVAVPNPEMAETLSLGIEQMKAAKSDLLLATDPDADRLGIVALHKGEPHILTGNQIAALCIYHICTTLQERGKLPAKGAFVTTIVSSDLLGEIARSFQQSCFEVLTGFKYIAQLIRLWEEDPEQGFQFLFGAEESYGYLIGSIVRDKDAVAASCLLAEIALKAKLEGKTIIDRLQEIFEIYGRYAEKQASLSFSAGKEGMETMRSIMKHLREKSPLRFCGKEVEIFEDYQTGERFFPATGKREKLSLPQSDVLLFRFADKNKLVIRPSGTEPKIKIYAGIKTDSSASTKNCENALDLLLSLAKTELKSP